MDLLKKSCLSTNQGNSKNHLTELAIGSGFKLFKALVRLCLPIIFHAV